MIAGITGFVQRRGFRAVTEDFEKFSEEEVGFSELASNCTVNPVSGNCEFFSETGEGDGFLSISGESGDVSKITPLSETLVTGILVQK